MQNAAKGKGGYLEFKDSWFDRDSDETPDGSDVAKEMKMLEEWEL
jgi:hypothetical protein